MDLTPDDNQRMLRDIAARFVTERYDLAARRRGLGEPDGFSRENWHRFAELGWLGVPFAEDVGGFGGGPVEVAILMEELGRGIATEPYLATVLLAGMLIAECGDADRKRKLLSSIVNGQLLLAFAHYETDARAGLSKVETRAHRDGDGWRLSGRKTAVLDGGAADMHVVSARRPGADKDDIGLFLVQKDAAGLTLRDGPRLGGGRIAELTLDGVRVPADAELGAAIDALPAIETVVDRAIAALAAEAVGLMRVMVDATVDYTKLRTQFGRPLAANQVIRHRLVDMYVRCEEARSMALRAALSVGPSSSVEQRALAASGAKAKIGRCARYVAEQAIQLHGAMGVTEELDLGLYFKRLLAFEALFGSTDYHLRRHAMLSEGIRVGEEASWS